jgi:glucosyl-3-phosphoglycerate synthase
MGLRSYHHSAFPPERIAAERIAAERMAAERMAAERMAAERIAGESIAAEKIAVERIAAERELTVSVCLPARECAQTVGEIVARLSRLGEEGVLDEIVVVDAASADGTAGIAELAGARVLQESELMPSLGPVLGKGDAMWRALRELSGDVVVYLDADTEGFDESFATGLIGPLVCELDVQFVKAFYRRPFRHGGVSLPEEGGRVNRLMAKPALRQFYPELSCIRQPLAGEVGARRELLQRIPFVTGYGVEMAMLIDVWREVGLEAMAQVDLEEHHNRHQPLAELESMAETVLSVVVQRALVEGRLSLGGGDGLAPGGPLLDIEERRDRTAVGWTEAARTEAAPVERPPLATLREL